MLLKKLALYISLLVMVGSIPSGPAADTALVSVSALLTRMHTQLEKIRSEPNSPVASFERPGLASLLRVDKATILSSLGKPDFCGLEIDDCIRSDHWAYFFHHNSVSEEETKSGTMITMTKGGWGVEISFDQNAKVDKAVWVQEN